MTLQKTKNKITVTANGSETTFSFDFRIDEESHVVIYYDGVEQDPTPSFTIAASDLGEEAGGDIVFDSAPPACDLTILRSVPYNQQTDYRPYDNFSAETHEAALDKIVMLAQQLDEQVLRAILSPVTSDLAIELPSPDAGKTLKWNSAEDNLENSTYDPDEAQVDATAAKNAAEAAQAAAETAQSNAETAESNAEDWADKAVDSPVNTGSEEVSNGGFGSDTTDWTALNSATLASVAGGQSGNCLQITENTGANPGAYQDLSLTEGGIYKLSVYVKEGTEATFKVFISKTDGSDKQYLDAFVQQEATGSWVEHIMYFKAPASTVRLTLQQIAESGAATTLLFDEVSVKNNDYSAKHWAFSPINGINSAHISDSEPTVNDGQNGDFWFQYYE